MYYLILISYDGEGNGTKFICIDGDGTGSGDDGDDDGDDDEDDDGDDDGDFRFNVDGGFLTTLSNNTSNILLPGLNPSGSMCPLSVPSLYCRFSK